MTRKDALNKTIGILTYHQVNFCKSKEAVANMNEIIEALEKIDQEQCGDCISREAVIHILDEVGGDFDSPREAVVPIDYIADMVSDLPSVTPQPKIGKWIKYGVPRCGEQHYKCTACGYYVNFGQWGELYTREFKYCPNCGCKMQEVKG